MIYMRQHLWWCTKSKWLCDVANMEDDTAGMMMLHTWGWGVFVMEQNLCDGATLRLQEAPFAPRAHAHQNLHFFQIKDKTFEICTTCNYTARSRIQEASVAQGAHVYQCKHSINPLRFGRVPYTSKLSISYQFSCPGQLHCLWHSHMMACTWRWDNY